MLSGYLYGVAIAFLAALFCSFMLFLAIKAKKAVSVHAKVLPVRPTAQNAATVTFEFDDGNRASLTGNGCTLMEGETGMLCYFGGTYHSFQMDTAC